MKFFKIFLFSLAFLVLSKSFGATTYYACSSGSSAIWDNSVAQGSTLILYTNSTCTTGAIAINSVTWGNGDVLNIQSGASITVYNNQSISADITINVYGSLLFNNGGGNPGKLSLSNNSSINVKSGGTVSCTTNNGASTTTCSNSDQLSVGGYTYKGTALTGITGPTVLAVTLLSFSAEAKTSSVELLWATGSEINFNYFSVERSVNGKDFYEIAQVKGQGTATLGKEYSFSDQSPIIGRSYYRLTSVDFDNSQQTFEVVSIEYQGEKKFTVSPNPSDGSTINLNFNFDKAAEGLVTIYDNMGVLIGAYSLTESQSISFSSPLRSGVYLAKYSSAAFAKTERFVVK